MKILHIIFSFLTGGAETMLVDIVNEQSRRGHDVELLIVNSKVNEDIVSTVSPRVRITRFNRREGSKPLLLLFRLNLYVIRRKPDIIHLHTYKLNGLLRIRNSTTVYTVHDLNLPTHYSRHRNMAAISDAVRDDVCHRVPGAKVRTIANGINTDNIRRRDAGAVAGEIKIVQVASLIASKKGQDILIDAVAILRERGYDVAAYFIGGGDDLGQLEKQAEALGIGEYVHFLGIKSRAEVYSTLSGFDIMCHPARYEGFGLTVAEGMAAGLPLVLPEGGGPWEVADRGRLCTTFTGGEARSCADAIAAVIDGGETIRTRTAEAADYVARKYSVRRMVDDYDRYYSDLLRGKQV